MLTIILAFLVVLSVLVFAHELGHFWTARRFGAEVEEFGFGLPPRIFGIRKINGRWQWLGKKDPTEEAPKDGRDHTIYSLNWIPVGGFVKIRGENGELENEEDSNRSFATKPIWQRATILSAGVIMNVVLCAVLLAIGFMIGMPAATDGIDERATVTNAKLQIVQVLDDLPAKEAEIKMGDVLIAINGQSVEKISEVQVALSSLVGQTTSVIIGRGGEEITKEVNVVQYNESIGIGVALAETGIVRYPWYLAIWYGIKATYIWLIAIITAFAILIKNLIIGAPTGVEVAGPVGIAVLTGQAARMGIVYVMQFTALFSLNLAIINILPIPALDGGRLLFLLIEKIRGKAVKQKWENLSHNIGFILLMVFVVFITYKDIARYSGRIAIFFKGLIGI